MYSFLYELILNRCHIRSILNIGISNSQLENLFILDYNSEYIYNKILEYKYYDTFEILYKLNLLIVNDIIFYHICDYGNLKLVKLVINDPKIISTKSHLIYRNYFNANDLTIGYVCQYNHCKILKLLLKSCKFKVPEPDYEFVNACSNNRIKIAKIIHNFIINNNIVIDLQQIYHDSFVYSVKKNCYKGIKFLLKLGVIDPSEENNAPLKLAIQLKHYKIIKLLLDCESVNPSVDDNILIKTAIDKYNFKIINLLLECPRLKIYDPKLIWKLMKFKIANFLKK